MNRVKTTALAVASVLLIGTHAFAAERVTTSGRPYARLLAAEAGIPRFAEICPGLARGGDPTERGLCYLKSNGYRTVVSFLEDSAESTFVVNSGMTYVHIPIRSSFFGSDLPTDEQVSRFLSVAGDTTLYPMFIHCHAGKDRTGAMAAIYRVHACGWSKEDAMDEMAGFGFSSRYKRLRGFVRDYPMPAVAASAPGAPPMQAGRTGAAVTAKARVDSTFVAPALEVAR